MNPYISAPKNPLYFSLFLSLSFHRLRLYVCKGLHSYFKNYAYLPFVSNYI